MTLTQILQKISSIFAKKSELSNYLSLSGGNVSSLTVNGKNVALDSDVVHKSGNETIGNNKTFSLITLKSSRIERGELPSSNIIEDREIEIVDKNNRRIFGIFNYHYANGGGRTTFYAYNPNTTDYDNIALSFDFDNTNNKKSLMSTVNNTVNLGTSTNKWKDVNTTLINGLNVGALSLPKWGGNSQTLTIATSGSTTIKSIYNGYLWVIAVGNYPSFKIANFSIELWGYHPNYATVLIPISVNEEFTISNIINTTRFVSYIIESKGNI